MAEQIEKKRVILISVDQSEESTYSLTWALKNIILPTDKVHLLHVQPLTNVYAGPAGPGHAQLGAAAGFYVTPEVVESVQKHEAAVSRNVLKAAKHLCDAANITAEADVVIGEPRDSICDAVNQLHADILVMGSHGYGAIKRAVLGSVSDYCVHHAKCPVVVVRKV